MPRKPAETPADAALARLRTICMALPATGEKLSRGAPVFHVKDRLFVMFLDEHHDDGRIAAWCKATHEEQRRLVAEDPDQYFVPPYVGVSGWVGVRLDRPQTDWIALSMIAENGWTAVAPKAVREGRWVPKGKPPPPPVRKTTDARVAREALARVKTLGLALPDAECEQEGQHACFRVRGKVFAWFLDNHHGDGRVSICVKTGTEEAARLAKKDPERFHLPAYMTRQGYVGVRLDGPKVDWKDVAARLARSHEVTTAKHPRPVAKTPRRPPPTPRAKVGARKSR